MDFHQTKYEGVRMEPQDATSTDRSDLSFDELSQRPAQSDSKPQQRPAKEADRNPALLRSKYEMNLAEFPYAVLSKNHPDKLAVIEYEDTIKGKNGAVIARLWRLKPSIEYGFGSTELTSLLFEIFQIWKEQGFQSRRIYVGSIYNLIQRMNLSVTSTKTYERITADLHALVEMSVEARNAFWDNEKKAYVSKTFHLFDEVNLYHRSEHSSHQETLPFSNIVASETLWHSIESNTLVTLKGVGRELFYSLTPTEQKLGLYLAKVLGNKTEYRRDVDSLARQIPIFAKTYKDTKKILSRRCDGLIEKKFPYLSNYHFEPSTQVGKDNIIFNRKPTTGLLSESSGDPEERRAKEAFIVDEILRVTGDEHSRRFYQLVAQKLPLQNIYTCLSLTKAVKDQNHPKPAAYFTTLIKDYVHKNGITL
jgi:hypothetical protein